MRVAASRDCNELTTEPLVQTTPDSFADGIAQFSEMVAELCGDEPVTMAAGGVAGPLSAEKDRLVNSPNNPDWKDKPLRDELSKALDAPVILENDTAVIGLGETHFGPGKGNEIVVYMTVSTGVGGARIVNGHVDVSRNGFEPGHQIIDLDGSMCSVCNTANTHGAGHLEGYVSGTATEHRFGVPPYEITDDETWQQVARWLAAGVNNTIVHWSPDIVVLGGAMIVKRPGIAVADVQKYLREFLTIFPESTHPPIVEATCGDHGGVWGAMELIKQHEQDKEK